MKNNLELCKKLQRYKVSKVIFAIEKDGIFIGNKNEEESYPTLVSEINYDELDNLKLANLGNKIDVTGGIRGKIVETYKEFQLGPW